MRNVELSGGEGNTPEVITVLTGGLVGEPEYLSEAGGEESRTEEEERGEHDGTA